jgi:hypothetical protein
VVVNHRHFDPQPLHTQRTTTHTNDDGSTFVRGATEVALSTPAELLELLATAMRARATSATVVHNQSSRSHALCYIPSARGRSRCDG